MKILVYGAGVLGCNLARNLLRAGKDVTLLARGNWAEEIRKNGLRIKVNCTPFVRQYDILSKKWGVLLCQKEYQTNDIRRSSREWL